MESEYIRKPYPAICEDGKVRTAYVRCARYDGSMVADTYFSVPAYVRVNGKYVAGYVTGAEASSNGGHELEFRAYTYCKNWKLVEA